MITDDEVMRLFERADPARADDTAPRLDAAGYLAALRTRSSDVTIIDIPPTPTGPTSRRRWPIITAVAAAVVALIAAGAVVLATRDDDTDEIPVVPSTTTAAEVARGFVEAYGALDADQAITYLADDADIAGLTEAYTNEEVEGTLDQLRLVISFLEAAGHQQMLDSCDELSSSATGTSVRCTYDFHSLGSNELGRGPFSGSYFDLTVRDGEIVQASTYLETERFSPQMWEPFAAWMDATHPDDAAVIFTPGGNGARATEEAIPLWEQNVREHVADVVARGFVEAYGALDVDQALTYLADDADITGLIDWFTTEDVQGTRDELRLLFSLQEAQSYQQLRDSCGDVSGSATGTSVRCTFDFHALRSDELGLGPFSGNYFDLAVRDGQIVRASYHSNDEQFSAQVWSPFASWMHANHPEEEAVMFTPGGNGARLTEESIPLWEQHTRDYVAAQAAED